MGCLGTLGVSATPLLIVRWSSLPWLLHFDVEFRNLELFQGPKEWSSNCWPPGPPGRGEGEVDEASGTRSLVCLTWSDPRPEVVAG